MIDRTDIFGEDFDTKYTLKIKSPGPSDVVSATLADSLSKCFEQHNHP